MIESCPHSRVMQGCHPSPQFGQKHRAAPKNTGSEETSQRHWSLRPGLMGMGLWGWAGGWWHRFDLFIHIQNYWTMIPWLFCFSSLVICLNYQSLHFSSFDSSSSLDWQIWQGNEVMSSDRGPGAGCLSTSLVSGRSVSTANQGCCFTFLVLTDWSHYLYS